MKTIFSFFVMMLLPTIAWAQSLSIDQCQQLAQDNYPLIKQYDLIRQTTAFNVNVIDKAWLPQVSAMAQASLQSDVPSFPDAFSAILAAQGMETKGMRSEQYRIGVDVSQTLWEGGVIRSQKEVARRKGDVQAAQTGTDLYAIRQRINDMFFQILLIDERIRLNANLQTLLQSNLDKLNAMLAHGVAMACDVNTMKAELLKAQQQATELQASKKCVMDMLAVWVGQKFTSLVVPPDVAVPTEQCHRPELQLFDSQIRLTESEEKLLDARLMPKLSVFAQGAFGYPGYNQFDAMWNRKWHLDGILGVKISWNIGALYTRKNDLALLKTQRDVVNTNRETFLFNTRLQELQQSEGIATFRRLIDADRQLIDLRSEVRRAAESKLQHGIIDTNNLLQEINRENEARINLSTHHIQMLKEIYNLKFTTNN
ncbi:MAG: TolC family protein [Sodaliphilus sp.]